MPTSRRLFWLVIVGCLLIIVVDGYRLTRAAWLTYQSGLTGKQSLEQSWQLAKDGEWPRAQTAVQQAQQSFLAARDHSQVLANHWLLSRIGWYHQQTNSVYNLLKSAELACQTAVDVFAQAEQWQSNWPSGLTAASLENLTPSSTAQILSQMQGIQPLLLKTLTNLHELEGSLNQVNFAVGLTRLNAPVGELRQALQDGKALLAEHLPWLQLAPYLAGQISDGRFLLILQNNDELRPTGGFIGNYGLLELRDGQVINLETHDSYHLDMPAQDYFKPAPPAELNKYLGVRQWFLRDANWSPDFPTTARQVRYFYQEQTKAIAKATTTERIDGVIAITPAIVEDLLGLVGPITVEDQTYDQQNFVELLQYRVEMSYDNYGVTSWNRKEVINDVIRELEKRLLALPASRWTEVARIITKNLERKNILLYSDNQAVQQWLVQQNWAGQARSFDGDYLWVIDANLAAFKTDAVVDKQINYRLYQSGGQWLAELRLNYKHNGGFDWRTTRYQTYTRVYAPLGSQLISQTGYKDVATTTQELGKTVFGGFIVVEPKKTKEIKLVYRLPDSVTKLLEQGRYELLLQKQPGRQRTSLSLELDLPRSAQRAYSEQLPLNIKDSQVNGQSGWLEDNQVTVSF
jgi:hypothetical protein